MSKKQHENNYEIKDEVAIITVSKKNGGEITTKVDAADIDRIKAAGIWHAEWNKDFNSYIIFTGGKDKGGGKNKQSLQSLVLSVHPKAPVRFINGDTLDNRKSNLEVVERNTKNEYEEHEDHFAIILKDKYAKPIAKALISKSDLDAVKDYSWVTYKKRDNVYVVANTEGGRIYLDALLMNPLEEHKVHHINLNPLDCRRENMEFKTMVEEIETAEDNNDEK